MTCQDIDKFLDQRSGPDDLVPQSVAEHLQHCELCRRLFRWLRYGSPHWQPSNWLKLQIEGAVLGSLQPVSPLPPARTFVLGFLAVFVLVLLVGFGITGIRSPQVMSFGQFAGVGSILAAGVVLLATSLSRQVAPGARHRFDPKVLVFSITILFVSAFLLLFPWRRDGTFWSWGLHCFSFGSLLAVLGTIPLWLLVRRGAVLLPALTGATMGLLAGLFGATAIHLGCLNVTAPHLAIWHAAVPISCALMGFLLGNLWSRSARAQSQQRLGP